MRNHTPVHVDLLVVLLAVLCPLGAGCVAGDTRGSSDGGLGVHDSGGRETDGAAGDSSTGACPSGDCTAPQRQCPPEGVSPDGTLCDPIGSDWWPDREADEAGTDHTPPGSEILDLHAEHITPYGAWFSYTAIADPEYRWDTLLCWSRDPTELDTAAGVDAANTRGDCLLQAVRSRAGFAIENPFIVTAMEPATVYYARVGVLHWEGSVEGEHLSNVVRFETRPDPMVALPESHPRVVATPELLEKLRERHEARDARTLHWAALMGPRALWAAAPDTTVYEPGGYGTSAGLLWHATRDDRYLGAARQLLLNELLPQYEDNRLTANQYRWAGQALGATADLIWSELSTAEKQRVVDAMLPEDEDPENTDPRFADTDQYVANTHIQITHGLAILNSPELSAESLTRMRGVFDAAIRRWYGVLQVKMRRAEKIYGLSGGTMDDGTDYARGTQGHWLETLWALDNVGMSQRSYAEWVWNNVRTHNIYAAVPDGSGVVTFGDVEDDTVLPDGTHIIDDGWTTAALKMGLLERWGRIAEAGYTRASLLARRPTDRDLADWALLTDHDDFAAGNLAELPTAFRASGFGQVFDRTGWTAGDSFFYFTAGWRGVDHNHPDVGHFSLWSGGAWVTHEMPSYDLVAENHNVVLIREVGQLALSSQGSSRILRTEATEDHLFILADTTAAYMDIGDRVFPFASVLRALFWDKNTDRVVVYDRLVGVDAGAQQGIRGAPAMTLFDEHADGVTELLMVVNGTGSLHLAADAIGVDGLVVFSRETGELR